MSISAAESPQDAIVINNSVVDKVAAAQIIAIVKPGLVIAYSSITKPGFVSSIRQTLVIRSTSTKELFLL